MIKTIIQREIQQNLYSLRFLIALLVTIGLFITGSLSFLRNQEVNINKYSDYQTEFLEKLQNEANRNASHLAVNERTYMLRPRGNGFISDCMEKYLPNAFEYNAYNVFSFFNRSGSANPLLTQFQEINWFFIVSLIISFVVLLFTFDAISGEKESRTLALTLSNPFSRGKLLFGKYISAIITVMLITITGSIFSMLIVLFSNQVTVSTTILLEWFGFVFLLFLLVSCLAAFGLLSSVLFRNSNISLLIALAFWLVFVVVIPNSSTFLAKKIFSIEREDAISKKIGEVHDDLNRNAPDGSWAMAYNRPFAPEHKLRADLQMKRMNSEKQIRDAYYLDMFRQFERTRLLTVISPVSLFEYMTEAVVGGGYVRFQKVWSDIHIYQNQFLTFFQEIDAQDTDSPHWYNPYEDVSTTRKPVNFNEVPLFEEKAISFGERFAFASIYLLVIVLYTAVIFFLTFMLFVRYDVR